MDLPYTLRGQATFQAESKEWLMSLALFLSFYTSFQFLPKYIININDYFLKSGIQEKVFG